MSASDPTPGRRTKPPDCFPPAEVALPLRFVRWVRRGALAAVTLACLAGFVLAVLAILVANVTSEFFEWSMIPALFRQKHVISAIKLSALTSGITLGMVVTFALGCTYLCLSLLRLL